LVIEHDADVDLARTGSAEERFDGGAAIAVDKREVVDEAPADKINEVTLLRGGADGGNDVAKSVVSVDVRE
jgi:hypothetical protein